MKRALALASICAALPGQIVSSPTGCQRWAPNGVPVTLGTLGSAPASPTGGWAVFAIDGVAAGDLAVLFLGHEETTTSVLGLPVGGSLGALVPGWNMASCCICTSGDLQVANVATGPQVTLWTYIPASVALYGPFLVQGLVSDPSPLGWTMTENMLEYHY